MKQPIQMLNTAGEINECTDVARLRWNCAVYLRALQEAVSELSQISTLINRREEIIPESEHAGCLIGFAIEQVERG